MTKAKKTRPVGRPSTGFDPIRGVRISDELMSKIEAWQYSRGLVDIPNLTVSGAIRQLLIRALIADGVIKKGHPLWQAF